MLQLLAKIMRTTQDAEMLAVAYRLYVVDAAVQPPVVVLVYESNVG